MATDWDTLAQLFYNGSYNLLTTDVNEAAGVKIQSGVTDEGTLRPSKINFRLNDPTDKYRPSNPSSALWPQLHLYTLGAFATGGTVRATGEVASYKPGQTDYIKLSAGTVIRGDRWVDVEVQGQLGRMSQWDDNLESALRHQLGGYASSIGYWPGEDGRDAVKLSNVLAGGAPGFITGASLQGADGPAGSDKVLTLPSGAAIGGTFATSSTTAGWQFGFAIKATASDATRRPIMTFRTSNGYRWSITQDNGSYGLVVLDGTSDENVLEDNFTSYGTGAEAGQWIYFRIKVTASGGTVTAGLGWYPQNSAVLWGFTSTFTGTVGRLTTWRADGNASNADGAYGQIIGLAGVADDIQSSDFVDAFDGYDGETAGDRYARLMSQAGLSYRVLGTAADSTPMGPQPIDTLVNLLKEIGTTEDGLIFDRAGAQGTDFRLRNHMLNQTVGLALTWPTNVAPPLAEVVDPLDTFNDVTVSDRAGGTANATLLTGPGSIAAITRVRKTVNVNVAIGTDLQQVAIYWLNRYTVQGSRFTSVTVDLDAQPSLATAAAAVGIGDVITVAGRTPDLLRLQVTAIDETVQRKRRIITFTVRPADLLAAAIYNDTGTRMNAVGHVISGGPFAGGVSPIKVNIAGGDGLAWTHADGNFPIEVHGEVMTVTAVAAPVAGVQSLTVTRGVNGVSNSLANGDSVVLSNPARYA